MPLIAIVGMGPGVSAAVARRFGRERFEVAAIARRADALKAQTDALADAHGYVADAADPSSLAAALARVAADHGVPSVLVYNAAAMRYKPLAQLSADELNADLRISIGGALAAAQAVLPAMRESKVRARCCSPVVASPSSPCRRWRRSAWARQASATSLSASLRS